MAYQPIILIKIATSFSVQGKYENNWPEVEVVREGKKDESSSDEPLPQPIRITYGYSRDKQPDLTALSFKL